MKKHKTPLGGDPKDHLANERTFLAWVRTSIGMMAFGFVIEKFGLFIQKFAILANEYTVKDSSLQKTSSIFGIFLIGFGALICLFSLIDYKNIRKQIANGLYQPSNLLNIIITLSVIIIGTFLIFSSINFFSN